MVLSRAFYCLNNILPILVIQFKINNLQNFDAYLFFPFFPRSKETELFRSKMNRLSLSVRPILNRQALPTQLARPVLARSYISHRPSWADNTPVAPHEWGTKIAVSILLSTICLILQFEQNIIQMSSNVSTIRECPIEQNRTFDYVTQTKASENTL